VIFDVNLDGFEQLVLNKSQKLPVLVDFWADWCGPCHMIAPQLEQVVTGYDGKVVLAKLEVDAGENMKLAGRYQVRGFPTIILFQQGEEQARFSSARTASWIDNWLDENLA
jgi:thioredoxin 1